VFPFKRIPCRDVSPYIRRGPTNVGGSLSNVRPCYAARIAFTRSFARPVSVKTKIRRSFRRGGDHRLNSPVPVTITFLVKTRRCSENRYGFHTTKRQRGSDPYFYRPVDSVCPLRPRRRVDDTAETRASIIHEIFARDFRVGFPGKPRETLLT